MEKEVLVTRVGLEKMQERLEYLKTSKRHDVSERIRTAIEFGDISENSEYEDAKNEQAFIEGEILTLEKKLRNAKLIDETVGDISQVSLGCKVLLLDVETGEKSEYTIVGSSEANPALSMISNESPVGRAALGGKVGAFIDADAPFGMVKYQIVSIG